MKCLPSLLFVIVSAAAGPAAQESSPKDLAAPVVRFDENGLQSVDYGKAAIVSSGNGDFELKRVELREHRLLELDARDARGRLTRKESHPIIDDRWRSAASLDAVKASFDEKTRTRAVGYSWGSVSCTYEIVRNRLDLLVRIQNSSDRDVDGLELTLMKINISPHERITIDNDELLGFHRMDFDEGSLVVCNWEASPPVHLTIEGSRDQPRATLGVTIPKEEWPHHPVVWDRFFHIPGRPIAPSETDEYHVSLNFGGRDAEVRDLCGECFEHFRNVLPMKLDWPDRRPIGRLFLCHPFRRWESNPRGYLPGKGKDNDVLTPEGLAEFRLGLLEYADNAVKILKHMDAQGVIVWDLEGAEYWHPLTYIGNPHQMSFVSPEMERLSNEFLKKFTAAGLRVGLCIRPTELGLGIRPHARFYHRDVPNPVEHLDQKIAYCKKRWGVTIFYFDSNVYPVGDWDPWWSGATDERIRWVMPTPIIRELAERHSDVLIIPEHETGAYHLYAAPYKTQIIDEYRGDPRVQAIYPQAFSLVTSQGLRMESEWETYVAGAVRGDVMFCEGWYNPLHNAYAKLIREEAGYVKAGRPESVSQAGLNELVELTRNESSAVRYHAAAALGKHKTARAAEALCLLLEDESIVVRRAAAEALTAAAPSDADTALAALMNVLSATEAEMGIVKRYAAVALGSLGASAVAPLVTLIAGAERAPEKYVLQALGATKTTDPAAAELIVAQMETARSAQLRIFACRAAGEARMTAAVPALIATLDDETEIVVEAAVWALGEIREDGAVAPLIGLFDREFKTWARMRIPAEIDAALKKITGKDLAGRGQWRPAFPAGT